MANETINVSQLYETGNKKFFAASLNPDGTFGEKQYHQGLMEVSIEFKSETTEIGADDDVLFVNADNGVFRIKKETNVDHAHNFATNKN